MASKLRKALLLYAFGVLGMFLLVAPWTPVWTQATIALLPTSVGSWVMSGWVRGLASGIGALDLIAALQVATELWKNMSTGESSAPKDRR